MLVLVDTPIWSLALRRKAADLNPREHRLISALRELLEDGRAHLIGPVRQELLSAARWQPAKHVSEPKPQVNSGKIPNTNFTNAKSPLFYW